MNWRWLPDVRDGEGFFDDAGTIVLTLHPEWTRNSNKSQAWVWKLPAPYAQDIRHGINWGSHADKETARQQGLAALDKATKVTVPDSEDGLYRSRAGTTQEVKRG